MDSKFKENKATIQRIHWVMHTIAQIICMVLIMATVLIEVQHNVPVGMA